jgi:hypothetical protein
VKKQSRKKREAELKDASKGSTTPGRRSRRPAGSARPLAAAPDKGPAPYVVDLFGVYCDLLGDEESDASFATFAEARAFALERVEGDMATLRALAEALRAANDISSLDLGWYRSVLTVSEDDEGDEIDDED